jgi:protein-disulfide isomerase
MLGMSATNKKKDAQQARLEREAAERAAAERSKRIKLLGGAAAVVVVILAIVFASGAFKDNTNNASESKVDTGEGKVTLKGINETNALLKGLPQDGTLLGKPDAPVTIIEFADLKCPVCQQYEVTQQKKTVDSLVRTGKANLKIQLINVIDPNQGTTDGAKARVAASNLIASDKFWPFVSTVYYNQGLENDTWATDKRLKQIAAGAPGVGVDALNTRETSASRTAIADADKLAEQLGVQGTPSFYVNPRGTRVYTPVADPASGMASAVAEAAKSAKTAQ